MKAQKKTVSGYDCGIHPFPFPILLTFFLNQKRQNDAVRQGKSWMCSYREMR